VRVTGTGLEPAIRGGTPQVFCAVVRGAYLGNIVLVERRLPHVRAGQRSIGVYTRCGNRVGLWTQEGYLWLLDDDHTYRVLGEAVWDSHTCGTVTGLAGVAAEESRSGLASRIGDGPLSVSRIDEYFSVDTPRVLLELSLVTFSNFQSWASSHPVGRNMNIPTLVARWLSCRPPFEQWYETSIRPVLSRCQALGRRP
jgi:hypothetical protein